MSDLRKYVGGTNRSIKSRQYESVWNDPSKADGSQWHLSLDLSIFPNQPIGLSK